jgi:hypothetical protein
MWMKNRVCAQKPVRQIVQFKSKFVTVDKGSAMLCKPGYVSLDDDHELCNVEQTSRPRLSPRIILQCGKFPIGKVEIFKLKKWKNYRKFPEIFQKRIFPFCKWKHCHPENWGLNPDVIFLLNLFCDERCL